MIVDNVFEFLIVYELTVVVIYALVSVRYKHPQAQRAASLTLTLAKLGGGAVLAGMVLLAVKAGSFSFEQLVHRGPQLSSAVRGVCFALLFAGFAVKAALIPLQTWLPGAYGESDADSSGFIAAISLNIAFSRCSVFGSAPWTSRRVVGRRDTHGRLVDGVDWHPWRHPSASAAGVRRLSSIENACLIVTDLGLALMGKAQHHLDSGARADRGDVPDHGAQLREGRPVRRRGHGRTQHRDQRYGAARWAVQITTGGGHRDIGRWGRAGRAPSVQRLCLRVVGP